ncbi:MAG: DMT family transporter, partial [Gemmatimonadales bacterium]
MPDAAPRRSLLAPHLALAGAQISFGLVGVFGQIVFQPGGLSPLAVGAWRLTAGAAIILAIAVTWYRRRALPARADLPRFVVAAALGVALNQWFFLEGLSRSTPINAALIMCLIPVFTVALATAVGLERFSIVRLAGVCIALAGTLALILDRGLTTLGTHGVGNLLMVTNALFYSGFLIVTKPLLRRYPPLVVLAWAYTLSLVFVPVFAWGERLTPEAGHVSAWWALGFIILFPTVLSYILNVFALSRVSASTTAIYIYAQPLIAALASWVAFRERPTPAMLLAAPALFVGIRLVSRPAPEPAREVA